MKTCALRLGDTYTYDTELHSSPFPRVEMLVALALRFEDLPEHEQQAFLEIEARNPMKRARESLYVSYLQRWLKADGEEAWRAVTPGYLWQDVFAATRRPFALKASERAPFTSA